MKVMVLLLVFLVVDGIASVCMSTNGTTQGLSVYQRVCCVINNLGRSHTIKGNGIMVWYQWYQCVNKSEDTNIMLFMHFVHLELA